MDTTVFLSLTHMDLEEEENEVYMNESKVIFQVQSAVQSFHTQMDSDVGKKAKNYLNESEPTH